MLLGLYDIHIQLAGVPLLGWEPPPLSATTYASEIMSYPGMYNVYNIR